MKVCHVNLATGFSGGEQQTLLLIEQQRALGYDLTIVGASGSPFVQRARALGCSVVETRHFLVGHARRTTADVRCIHVHEGRAVYWALLQHLLFGTPFLITRRIDNPLKHKFLLDLAYRRARHVVGLSRAIQSEIQKTHPDRSVEIIPSSPRTYPVDAAILAQMKRQFSGRFVVVQAAKFHAHKGHEVSIEAARKLQTSHPDIHFCLLGDGPELVSIRALATDLDNVSFPGQQSNMGDWFALADILIHPSHSEGLGSVILEANRAGLPVIATRAGGIPDIVTDGINGLLIPAGDGDALAHAIARLHDQPELRETMAENAVQFVRQFNIEETAKKYQALYATT